MDFLKSVNRHKRKIYMRRKEKKGEKIQKIKLRKLCASKVEWKYIYQLTDVIEQVDIRNYVANQIEWYVIKASRYRFWEYALKILAVVTPTVTMLAQKYMKEDFFLQAIVLGAATITTASSNFVKWHDKRVLYRESAEKIKEEAILYVTHAGKYSDEKRDENFVMKLSEIANSANDKWEKLEDDDKAGDKSVKSNT